MESIRKAGGKSNAKLRTVKERKLKKKAEKEQPAVSGGGGDLMSDLFAKLSMRRKGISGSKGESGGSSDSPVSAGSAMDRISAMIPAPPKDGHADSFHSAASDDWEP